MHKEHASSFIPFIKQSTHRDRNILDKKTSATFNKWRSIFGKITSIMASSKIFSDFAENKITADLGFAHMLIYSARRWRRLRSSSSYTELGFTNHSAFLNLAILW